MSLTMHLVRGMTSLNTRKQKPNKKSKRLLEAEAEHQIFLNRMGVKKKTVDYRYDIPDYKTGPRVTSDRVAGNGTKREALKYTGNELLGCATMHKSNCVPIRKDNKEEAINIANMRR